MAYRDLEKRRATMKAYQQRPEVQARRKAYFHRPEYKVLKAAQDKQIYEEHKDEALARARAYSTRPDVRAYRKEKRLKDKFGLTVSEVNSMLTKQGGRCAICGTDKFNGKGPQVDHDHNTGKVRDILCSKCNTALGLVGENVLTIKAMLEYVHRHNSNRSGEGCYVN